MNRIWISVVVAVASVASISCSAELSRYETQRPLMGTVFTVTLYAGDKAAADAAAQAAFGRIAHLNTVMSDYDRTSELSRLSATAGQGQAVRVSDELWYVLGRCRDVWQASDGAFDVTVGPIVRLWRRARRQGQMPPANRLAEAMAAVGFQHVKLNAEARTVELLQPDMLLDLGGIAKGYACDEALAELRRHGMSRAMVDGGGDIALGDPPPDKAGWRIGLAPLAEGGPPSRVLLLHNVAIATSGDAFQFVVIDAKRYSHIVDPKTGLGLTDHSSVSVIAPDGTTADALASAVSVLGPTKGIALADRTPGAAAFIVRKPADQVQTYQSKRMKQYWTTGREDGAAAGH